MATAPARPPAPGRQLDPLYHVNHQVDVDALRGLCEEAARATGCPVAVEVGSWTGSTALVIAEYFPEVYCVDTWQGSDPAGAQTAHGITVGIGPYAKDVSRRQVLHRFCHNVGGKLFRGVTPLVGDSRLWAPVFPHRAGFVFVDADHRYAETVADIRLWLPRLADGGCLAVHDYGLFDGTTQAVNDLLPGHRRAGRTVAWWRKGG